MKKENDIKKTYEELKNIKMGLLNLTYTAALHGKTIENHGREYTVPEFSRELACSVDSLNSELEYRAMEYNVLMNKKTHGETFVLSRARLEILKKGLLEVASAVERDKVTIKKGDKVYSVLNYERKLISDIESLEKDIKADVSKIRTALDNKFKPDTAMGMATGPLIEAN